MARVYNALRLNRSWFISLLFFSRLFARHINVFFQTRPFEEIK